MSVRGGGQTPGSHIPTVSKCCAFRVPLMQLFQRAAPASPPSTTPPPSRLYIEVYRPLKIVTRKLSCFTVMVWEPAVLRHTLREHQLINNNGGFSSRCGCLGPMNEATEPQGGAAAPEGSSSKVPAQGQPTRLIKPFSGSLLQQEDGMNQYPAEVSIILAPTRSEPRLRSIKVKVG